MRLLFAIFLSCRMPESVLNEITEHLILRLKTSQIADGVVAKESLKNLGVIPMRLFCGKNRERQMIDRDSGRGALWGGNGGQKECFALADLAWAEVTIL